MTPDEIRRALARSHRNLVAEERGDGWSFYLSPPQKGSRPNRIVRAAQASPGTRLKLAISSRHLRREVEITFTGDENALREYVDRELQLFAKHFAE